MKKSQPNKKKIEKSSKSHTAPDCGDSTAARLAGTGWLERETVLEPIVSSHHQCRVVGGKGGGWPVPSQGLAGKPTPANNHLNAFADSSLNHRALVTCQ